MSKLKRVGVVSWAEVRMFMSFIVGLIVALVYLAIGVSFVVLGDVDNGIIFLIFSIFFPLVIIILSFFIGLIEGLVFNIALNWAGGLEIRVDDF
jgi:hypothetical protein